MPWARAYFVAVHKAQLLYDRPFRGSFDVTILVLIFSKPNLSYDVPLHSLVLNELLFLDMSVCNHCPVLPTTYLEIE